MKVKREKKVGWYLLELISSNQQIFFEARYRNKLKWLFRFQRVLANQCSKSVAKRILLQLISIGVMDHPALDPSISVIRKQQIEMIIEYSANRSSLRNVTLRSSLQQNDEPKINFFGFVEDQMQPKQSKK